MQLHRDRDRFAAAGVELAVIGQGTPKQARAFAESQKVDLPLYVDRDRASYRAAGTKIATLGELLGPRSVARGVQRAMAERVRQGRTVLATPPPLDAATQAVPVTTAHARYAGDGTTVIPAATGAVAVAERPQRRNGAFIWVLLGILGGVETFGLLGLFVGPAIMAALILLWREWTGPAHDDVEMPSNRMA